MNTEQQKQEILAAVASGEFSQKKIDPKTSGKGVTRLKKGENVGADKIQEMHTNLIRLREGSQGVKPEANPQAVADRKVNVVSRRDDLQTQVDELTRVLQIEREERERLQAQTIELQKLTTELQRKIAEIEARESVEVYRGSEKGENVLGFILSRDKNGYWYANRYQDGNVQSVYIGRDKSKALTKIMAKLNPPDSATSNS